MTNNFSTVKLNQASEKFNLIRIAPRRLVNSFLMIYSGNIYEMTFAYPIQKITVNGIEFTKTTSTPTSGQFSYDELTKNLRIYLSNLTDPVVVFYYIFYTGGRYRVVNEDPEDSNTRLRDWQSLIKASPTISNSVENIITGTLSVSISSLSILNVAYDFQNYLTDYDSFYKAEIKIWLCIDSLDNIQKVYDGKISSLYMSKTEVSINFDASFTSLLDPALMGDSAEFAYITKEHYPNVDNAATDQVCPFMFGTASRYQLVPDTTLSYANSQRLDPSSLYRAINISHSNDITTSNNRTWALCRVDSNGFLQFGFTPTVVNNSNPNYTVLRGTNSAINNFRIGDTFTITQGSTYYARVFYVDKITNDLYINKIAAISVGCVVNSNNCPSIVVYNSQESYYPIYGRDYTASLTTTDGGNKQLKITFANNFEANHPDLTVLDIGRYQVSYRVRPNTSNHKHGSVVKTLLERAGLVVNNTSITNANADFDSLVSMSIPQFDESDYKDYLAYIELITSSTLSYIFVDNDFLINYALFKAPAATNEINDIDILNLSFRIELKYQDIITQFIAYNSHCSSSEATADPNNSPSVTRENIDAKYLHGIDKTSRFRHVLENINARIDILLAVRSNRYVKYIVDTKAINLDSLIGDDLRLVTNGILGNLTSRDLKIIGIDKNPKQTNIILTDLLGL